MLIPMSPGGTETGTSSEPAYIIYAGFFMLY